MNESKMKVAELLNEEEHLIELLKLEWYPHDEASRIALLKIKEKYGQFDIQN